MNSENSHRKQDNSIELVFHNIHDHGVEISDMWMQEVEKRTGGRVRFKKQTGEDQSSIAQADIVRDVPAMGGRYHLLDLVQLPFILPNSTIGSRVIAQLYAEFPELRSELSDVKVIGLGIGALMAFFSSKSWGPIHKPGDLKGAKTRSLQPIDKIIEALGANPVHVGFLEIGPMLGKGELDATVLGILPGRMFRLAEGAGPYCTIVGNRSITMHPMRTYMKWASWNNLPLDIRQILDNIGPAGGDCWFAVESGKDADAHLVEALDYMRKYGEIIEVPGEELPEWNRLIKPHVDVSIENVEAKGLPGKKFMARLNELVDEYSMQS